MPGESSALGAPEKLARTGVPGRLLEAATRLFAQQGFESTSVQEVVEAAGVTKGAMYHYFGSKDDLLYEIYHRVLSVQMERLEKLLSGDGSYAERVHAAAADVVMTSIANLDDTVIFFRSMHMLGTEKQALVRAERRRYHERFREVISDGQAAGEFRTDVPADLVVDYYFGAVHHLGIWYRRKGRLSGRKVAEHYGDMLISSLRTQSPLAKT
ncbi:TetR/AcrR family transcriptional regulator [Fodinicola feengrottensis]|uniref:TetR/AcrR family transcriptional regulator n=2 Tax=Fodinicola feengrottensis TaxID=435914 RepID=A0ABN2ISF7_9ACTN